MIRISHSTRGGSVPSRDAAPAMKYDVHLPRGQRAGFERLIDPATMRLTVMDEGSLGLRPLTSMSGWSTRTPSGD
jgi:hypothetical protein